MKYKSYLSYALTVLACVLFAYLGSLWANSDKPDFENIYDDEYQKAQVQELLRRENDSGGYGGESIVFSAKLLAGENKGETLLARQQHDPQLTTNLKEVEVGDKVLLLRDIYTENAIPWVVADYVRLDTILVFALVFAVLLLVFGRKQGINTIFSLGLTIFAIFGMLIPAILSGKNIHFWAWLVVLYMVIATLLIVYGFTKKSLCAMLGCLGGIVSISLLTAIADASLSLTGMVDEDSYYLTTLLEGNPIDLKAILFAGILIGAIGAIMDVAISMASSLHELSQHAPDLTPKALFSAGLRIGRDMMGTMANTLVLAYIGGSLSVTLLLVAYSSSTQALLNREVLIVEMLQSLVGSFSLLLTIPLTAFIATWLFLPKQNNKK